MAVVLAWIVAGLLNRSGDASATLTRAVTPALIEKGAYLARAGDCVACHTSHDSNKPGIASPIGTLYSTKSRSILSVLLGPPRRLAESP